MHTSLHGHEEADRFNGMNALLEDDTSNYLVVMSDQSSTKCMSCAGLVLAIKVRSRMAELHVHNNISVKLPFKPHSVLRTGTLDAKTSAAFPVRRNLTVYEQIVLRFAEDVM